MATQHMATTTLRVEGMTCGACTSAVESGISALPGVGNVTVSLVTERAVVQHDNDKTTPEMIKEAVDDRGFDAEVLSSDLPLPPVQDFEVDLLGEEESDRLLPSTSITTVSVGGMTCGACTSAVEGAFKNVAGVKNFSISLLSERAVIEHDTSILSPEQIAEMIEDTGFDASIVDTKSASIPPPNSISKHKRQQSAKQIKNTTVSIQGMTCSACTSAVEGGFTDLDGVIKFNISLLAERAVISHDPGKLSAEAIVETIEDRGFDAYIVSSEDLTSEDTSASGGMQLKIYGMLQPEDATALETTLRGKRGVQYANISFGTGRANISYNASIVGIRTLVEMIEEAGFNALLAENDDNNAQLESLAKTKEIQEWRRAFRISISFAVPVFFISMVIPLCIPAWDFGSTELPIPGLWLGDVICMLLTIPVQFGIGKRFYISAYKSLKHGSPTMDVLVVLGTSAAFFFSVAAMVVSVLTPPHSRPATVFDTSTMLITFITLGRLLENGAKSQTSRALSRLMSLAPSMATIYADPIAAEKGFEVQGKEKIKEISPKDDEQSSGTSAEKVVPSEFLEVGDIVILRPGDKIPADGTVAKGETYVDESMVTGEAMPILKKPGSILMAGTVNGAGRLDFHVTRAGRDTQLSQIVRLVQEAQTSRAPIQRMADIVAGYFVPIIITLGLVTFASWMVLSHVLPNPPRVFLDSASGGTFMVCLKLCISVIVFACPCALGLATPTAVMVGTGVGAEQGILVKGGATLETATKITHVVFDKTGTLTSGKMGVSKFDILQSSASKNSGVDKALWKRFWWNMVGLAEMSSEHPIGRAIVRAAKEELNIGSEGSFNGSVEKFEAVIGKGIEVTVQTSDARFVSVLVGNMSFLQSHGIKPPIGSLASELLDPEETAKTVEDEMPGTTNIHVAIDNEYAGTLYLSDTIKPSAAATVTALRLLRIPSSIVTGDAQPTALSVAKLVNIPSSNVHASATPSQKQAFIRSLQLQGHVVAMVGDGINDSPALATANVGISLASGTDVAMEAADIVLMRSGPNDLLDVAAALQLARTIFNRIKLNLAWACGYNLIGLPFAMGVFLPWGLSLPPIAAGAAMACSSVSVVVSSLLLKFWKRPRWMELSYLEVAAKKPPSRMEQWASAIPATIGQLVGSRRRENVVYVPLSNVETV